MSEQPAGETVSEPDPEAVAGEPAEPSTVMAGDRPAEVELESDAIARIATHSRRLVRERIRVALEGQTAAAAARQPLPEVDDEQLLDRIADEEAERADGPLLQVAVVHAVAEEFGIRIEDALDHPAVNRARQLLRPAVGTGSANAVAVDDDPEPAPTLDAQPGGALTPDDGTSRARPPRQRALLLDAVHVFGIETLEPGDPDIELRLADVGIDVRKPSKKETIGRLHWNEIRTVAVKRPRRGLPGRRRPALFVAGTDRGEVTFELPGVTEDEIAEHLEPLITRNCAGYFDADAG